MHRITVQLFHMPVIRLDGNVITFPLKKADALFFYMCIEKSATRTRLASLLWGGASDDAARKNLRNALYAIKQTFGFDPFESPKKQILRLNSGVSFEIDTDLFSESGNLDLYQDEFLSGFSLKDSYEFDEWMNGVRTHFADLYLQQLYQHFFDIPAASVSEREEVYHRYTAADPLDERIYLQMIRTYQENGQLLKGIRCYEELSSRLREELGISPSREALLLFHEMERQWKNQDTGPQEDRSENLLIGRERELSVLKKACHNLFLHKGGTVFVSGEKGIGKTYLCDSFLGTLDSQTALILRADCFEQEMQVPLRPWNAILSQIRRFLQTSSIKVPGKSMEIIRSCFPTIDSFSSPGLLVPGSSAAYNYRAVKNAVLQLLSTIGSAIPVILYVNDLTNMDQLSADWLSSLIRHNQGDILVIVTCPLLMNPWWEKYTGNLVRLKNVQKIILSPLTQDEVGQYLEKLLPDREITSALIDSVLKECRGNPFFLNVITENMAAPDSTWRVSGAMDILHSSVASLPVNERRILDLISVFQDGADVDALSFITGIDPIHLVDILDDLISREYMTEEVRGELSVFRFRQSIMQEFVRRHLSVSKSRLYHKRIAEYILQSSRPHNSFWYSGLIHHYKESGLPADSLYYRILQLEAYSNYSYDLYPVLPVSEEGETGSTAEVLGELLSLRQELSRCYTLYPDQIPYEDAEYRLNLIIARIAIQQGDYDTGLKTLEKGTGCQDNRLFRAYRRQLVYYGIQTWNLSVMKKALEDCLGTDASTGEIQELAVDHRLQGLYHNMMGEFSESDRLLETAVKEFQSAPLTLQSYTINIAACYNYLGENARKQGNYRKALGHFQAALALCRENDQMENPTFYVNMTRTYIALGDYEKARRCILKSRALYDSSDVQMCRSLSYICECFLEHKTGRIRQSRSALEMAKQTYAVLGSPRDALYFFRAAAYLKRTSPEDYSDLLPEPWEYYRDNADRISDSFSALSSEIKI
ncbi:MAG: AAA family ATPase [Lachnospiraceae bacterium]|nr:AAA family ATPase [Lachnospiraceae bacterium]